VGGPRLQPVLTTIQPLSQCALLEVSNLAVTYKAAGRGVPALSKVSFEVRAGEIVGVLGESGSGKSTLALSLLRLLPPLAELSGEIHFRGSDLLHLRGAELRSIRGATISLIHQEPGFALSPVMRVGDQIAEVLRAHCHLGSKARREKVINVLERVHLHDPGRIYRAYAHELSGGELHRAAVAQALACEPELLIADETTRSLDVTTQTEMVRLLVEFNRASGTAILFITHNPAVLAGFAHRILVMHGGHIVEQGTLPQVFGRPLHPYTQTLLSLVPQALRAGSRPRQAPTSVIPEAITSLSAIVAGCSFEPCCAKRMPACADKYPRDVTGEEGHRVSCLIYGN
jgi:peptide/nickel transport system ATP-binding protein